MKDETNTPKGPLEREVRRLPKSQQELLDALKSGVIVHYMRYMGSFNRHAYFFRHDTGQRVTAAANALISKGIVRCGRKTETLHLIA